MQTTTSDETVLTEDGWQQMSDQLAALRVQRTEKGAAYAELEDMLARATPVDGAGGPADTVRFGSRVRVRWTAAAAAGAAAGPLR